MDNTQKSEPSSSDPYLGYSAQPVAQPYGAEEMPQSTYPQQVSDPYASSGDQGYNQQQASSYTSAERGYEQQQSYGQQQQQQSYGQTQSGQPGFNPFQNSYQQGMAGDVGPLERTGMGMRARTAGMLCYLFGWVGGLVFLVLERENRFVRFHAMQSVLFFGILGLAEWFTSYFVYLDFLKGGLGVVSFIGWLFLFITANKGRYYKLPVLGDLAEQLLARFR